MRNILLLNFNTSSLLNKLFYVFKSVSNREYKFKVYVLDNSLDSVEFQNLCAAANSVFGCGRTVNDFEYLIYSNINFELHLFNSNSNLGYAGGMNFLLDKCTFSYDSILLNSDVALDDFILTSLLNHSFPYDVTGSLVINNGEPEFLYGDFQKDVYYSSSKVRLKTPDSVIWSSDWVTFACVFIKAKVFSTLFNVDGYVFDEDYFLYFEDVDFCFRSHLLNYSVGIDSSISVEHARSYSSGGAGSLLSLYYINRNRFLFLKKNIRTYPSFLKLLSIKIIVGFKYLNRFPAFFVYFKSIFHGVVGRTGRFDQF